MEKTYMCTEHYATVRDEWDQRPTNLTTIKEEIEEDLPDDDEDVKSRCNTDSCLCTTGGTFRQHIGMLPPVLWDS